MMRRLGERLQKQHAPSEPGGQAGPPTGAGSVSLDMLAAKSGGMIQKVKE